MMYMMISLIPITFTPVSCYLLPMLKVGFSLTLEARGRGEGNCLHRRDSVPLTLPSPQRGEGTVRTLLLRRSIQPIICSRLAVRGLLRRQISSTRPAPMRRNAQMSHQYRPVVTNPDFRNQLTYRVNSVTIVGFLVRSARPI